MNVAEEEEEEEESLEPVWDWVDWQIGDISTVKMRVYLHINRCEKTW